MPVTITRDQWLRDTAVTGRIRSTLLRRLDATIGNPEDRVVRNALSAWITDGHESWRTNLRNRTGIIQRLYNEVGLGRSFQDFMSRLLGVVCACRAGSRLLWVKKGTGTPAQVWIDAGRHSVVDEDCDHVERFYWIIRELGQEVTNRTAPPDLVRVLSSSRRQTNFGANVNFPEWAEATLGNCAEMGSSDGALWVEHICRRTGLSYAASGFQSSIVAAQLRGKREDEEYDKVRLQLQARRRVQMPGEDVLQRDVREYMTDIIRINYQGVRSGLISRALLEREYNKRRTKLLEEVYGNDEAYAADDLIPFARAYKEVTT